MDFHQSAAGGARGQKPEIRVLIMAAVSVEKEAIMRGLHGDSRFDVMVAGVGPAAAAASTAKALSAAKYGLVVSAGIGGGFPGKAEVGSLVVANEIVAADLGVETPDGFRSLDELGFGATRVGVDANLVTRLMEALSTAGLQVNSGPVLTVSTATGTAETAFKLAERVPGASAEGMEGYGVAIAAHDHGVPTIEIRAISNPVGPRDRDSWRIGQALGALEAASTVLVEVLQ